jgi:hypothetical protein
MLRRVIFVTSLSLTVYAAFVVGQSSPMLVTRVRAQSSDGVFIEAWLNQTKLRFGDSLRVKLRVANRGNRSIYLVRKAKPEIDVQETRILIEAPVPTPIGHGDYDYSFERLRPGSSSTSLIEIGADDFKEIGVTDIFLGLGFVYDITGLDRPLEAGEDPAKLRGTLAGRMQSLGVGNLRLDVFR